MKLVVGPQAWVDELVRIHQPDRVVSLLAPGQSGPRIADRAHLRLDFHDVAEAAPGVTPVDAAQLRRLHAFVLAPPRARCVLIHCWLGGSRSPAAALYLACALQPGEPASTLVARLRQASPSCSPNPRFIALADAELGREGRLIRAVEEAGAATPYSGPAAFDLHLPN